MAWKKGPLPAGTYNWGGVIPVGQDPKIGFYFADFWGDHVKLSPGDKILKADEVAWYDNSLCLPDGDGPPVKGRAGSGADTPTGD